MKKADWQYLVNTLLFICLVGIVLIGLLLGLVIPQGPAGSESSKYFLNLHRHQWGNIHFYLSLAFTLLIIIHLALDWKWIKARANHLFKKGWKIALTATVGVSLFLLFALWLFHPKDPGSYDEYGVGRKRSETVQTADNQDCITVTGQMRLQDLEKATGIPAQRIIEALGLPAKVSPEETIGRLRKKHGFSLVEARDVLTELLNEVADVQNRASPPQDYREANLEKERKSGEEVLGIHSGQEKTEGEREEEEKIIRGRLSEDQSSVLINGQSSLYEIQRQTGVPAQKIIEKLGLPQNVPQNENIGRLRRRFGFTLQEVRDAVESLIKNN
jgi:hypothetical protein